MSLALGMAEDVAVAPRGRTGTRTGRGPHEFLDTIRRKLLAPRGISDVSDQEFRDVLLEREDRSDFQARLDRPRR